MPVIELGQIAILLGAIASLIAAGWALSWARHRHHGRSTPGYARARSGRRAMTYALIVALGLFGFGLFTPAADIVVAGAS